MNPHRSPSSRAARCWRDRRGAVMVEYAFIALLVVVPATIGLTAGGVQALKHYHKTRDSVLLPVP